MADPMAAMWDRLLLIYGRWVPYHPKKWRVINLVVHKARATWTSPRRAKRGGIWFELELRSLLGRNLYYLGEFERWETRFVERVVKPGWVIADIGANVGYYSLLLSRLVGSRGCVYAFEPAASTYQALTQNIALNNAANVRPYRIALADSCGEASLVKPPEADPKDTHLARPDEPGTETTPVMTLDRFVEQQDVDRLDFIKVDIEGSERCFLSGAEGTLARFRPIIMIELNPKTLRLFGASVEEVVHALACAGYSLYRPTWRGLLPLCKPPALGQYFNVVALPSEGMRRAT